MPNFSILLDGFDKGKRPLPIKGSFWASIGLNPFLKKGKLTSQYYLKNEATSDILEDLGNVDQFAHTEISGMSSTLMVKSGHHIFKEVDSLWSSEHTCTLSHTAGHLGMVVSPHNGRLHWCSNEAVGKFDGTVWLDSWKSGLTNIYHYMLAIRDYILVSNGRYVAGWSAADGSDWSTALLDLEPGYNSKRMLMKKAAGTRQALIQGHYDTDRSKDGIFIWDLAATSPIDFISVPYMQDFFIENDIVYVIHGNQFNLSELVGTQLRYLNSISENAIFGVTPSSYTVNYSAEFLGKFLNLILISIKGTRAKSTTDDNFYSGVWAYNIENNSLFYWLPPSTGNLYDVNIGNIFIDKSDLWVASASSNNAGIKYYIDRLRKVSTGSGTFREMYISPILNAGSIATKIWKKIKSAHSRLLTTARILFKYRDFSRDLISIQQVIIGVGASTFNLSTSKGEVGDEVTVIAGTGAGQVRHITGIAGSESPFIYTIDEVWDTNPDTNSIIEIASWKKMSEKSAITNKEKDGRILTFSHRGITNQIKLVMEHPATQNIDIEGLRISGSEEPEE